MRELDEYFKDAAAELREFQLSTLPISPPEHTFSPQFEQAMRRMIDHELLSHKGAQLSAFMRRTYAKAFAVLLGISACVVSVGLWSPTYLEHISANYPDYVKFTLTGFSAPQFVSVPLTYELTAVPPDFQRVRHGRDPGGFLNYALWENAKGQVISFEQTPIGSAPLDAAHAYEDLGELTLPLGTARLFKDGGRHIVEWQANGYQFMVFSTLTREQTVALAEGVALKIRPFETMQTLPIEAVPTQYPPALALQNGDLVFVSNQPPVNPEKLTAFIAAHEQKQPYVVRLAEYIGSSIILHDLETRDGRIYYTRDEQRRPSSDQPWERGEAFEDVSLLSTSGKNVLLLHTRRYNDPVKVLQYN